MPTTTLAWDHRSAWPLARFDLSFGLAGEAFNQIETDVGFGRELRREPLRVSPVPRGDVALPGQCLQAACISLGSAREHDHLVHRAQAFQQPLAAGAAQVGQLAQRLLRDVLRGGDGGQWFGHDGTLEKSQPWRYARRQGEEQTNFVSLYFAARDPASAAKTPRPMNTAPASRRPRRRKPWLRNAGAAAPAASA
jgi:hypothetical protein